MGTQFPLSIGYNVLLVGSSAVGFLQSELMVPLSGDNNSGSAWLVQERVLGFSHFVNEKYQSLCCFTRAIQGEIAWLG